MGKVAEGFVEDSSGWMDLVAVFSRFVPRLSFRG